jgi:hypothetical protein
MLVHLWLYQLFRVDMICTALVQVDLDMYQVYMMDMFVVLFDCYVFLGHMNRMMFVLQRFVVFLLDNQHI